MTTAQHLLAEIEAFLRHTSMAATTLGIEACNDAHAVRRLRDGHGLTVRRADQLRAFMASYRPSGVPKRRRSRRKASDDTRRPAA